MKEGIPKPTYKAEAAADAVHESVRDTEAALLHLQEALTTLMGEGTGVTITRGADGTLSCAAPADSFASLLSNIKAVLAKQHETTNSAHFVAVVRGMHEVDIQLARA